MAHDVDEILGSFDDGSLSVRLVRAVCAVVPFAPELPSWYHMVDGLRELEPEAKKDVLDRAVALTRTDEAQRALWLVKSLDTADSGISVFSGVKSAYAMYQATSGTERLDALETDTQQAVDATLKCLALAYVVHKLFEGGPTEKIAAFRATETGKALLFYYAALEVGLPFADNALMGGGAVVSGLFERFGPEQQAKLAAVASPEEAEAAMGLMAKLTGPIETTAGMAREYLKPVADTVVGYLPTAMSAADKAAGAAATGADLLPVYRYLGSRLVAEACLRRALAEAEVAREERERASSAQVPVKYTRSANDLPDAPRRRRGCIPFFAALLCLAAAIPAALWSVA